MAKVAAPRDHGEHGGSGARRCAQGGRGGGGEGEGGHLRARLGHLLDLVVERLPLRHELVGDLQALHARAQLLHVGEDEEESLDAPQLLALAAARDVLLHLRSHGEGVRA